MSFSLDSHLIPTFGSIPLDRITRDQVMKWFDTYSQSAPGGANCMLRILRQILNFAVAHGYIESNPTRGINQNRRTAITRFLSRTELRRLRLALDSLSHKGIGARQQAGIIRLLLLTGCRRGEILSLRWNEVGKDTLALGDTKTGPRTVHLNAEARRIIERQPRGESAFVFPSPLYKDRPRGKHLPLWNTVRRQSGIEDVRLHDLRHTFASHAIMNGVPVPVVSRLLGHSNVSMTLRYAHLADKDAEAAAERIGEAMARVMDLRFAEPPRGVSGGIET